MPAVGFDGTVAEQDFARILALSGPRSIVASPTDWAISVTANPREISVAAGTGLLPGLKWNTTGASTVANATNSSGSTRYDLIVWRGDWSANTVTLTAITGTPGLGVPPTATYSLMAAGSVYDLPICVCRTISGGGAYTLATDIFDIRPYGGVGGLVVPQIQFAYRHDLVPGQLWIDASTGRHYRVDSTPALVEMGIDGISTIKYKTADEDVAASTGLQDDNHLVIPVAANSIYTIECGLIVSGSVGGDLQWQFSYPANAWMAQGGHGLHNSVTSNSGTMEAIAYVKDTASPSLSSNFGTVALGSPVLVRLSAILITGATAGNVTLRWAQFAASGTTRLHEGSWMRAIRG